MHVFLLSVTDNIITQLKLDSQQSLSAALLPGSKGRKTHERDRVCAVRGAFTIPYRLPLRLPSPFRLDPTNVFPHS